MREGLRGEGGTLTSLGMHTRMEYGVRLWEGRRELTRERTCVNGQIVRSNIDMM